MIIMKNIISEHNKTLIITLSIALIGTYGCILDYYNGETEVLPRLEIFSFLDEKIEKNPVGQPATYKIYERYITINSIWFIFIILGILLFYTELYEIKSPILIYGIPILLFYYINLKLLDGKIELYKYLIR